MTYSEFLEKIEEFDACQEGLKFAHKYGRFETLFQAIKKDVRVDYAYWLECKLPSIYDELEKDWPLLQKYDRIDHILSDGLHIVCLGGKCGFIDTEGKEVIPCIYDHVFKANDGLVCVQINGKWGYVNKKGEEVIPLKYESAWPFIDGIAEVKLGDEWIKIDKEGNEV